MEQAPAKMHPNDWKSNEKNKIRIETNELSKKFLSTELHEKTNLVSYSCFLRFCVASFDVAICAIVILLDSTIFRLQRRTSEKDFSIVWQISVFHFGSGSMESNCQRENDRRKQKN